jgi:diketogulonate reductase-like aldo/keto reductase
MPRLTRRRLLVSAAAAGAVSALRPARAFAHPDPAGTRPEPTAPGPGALVTKTIPSSGEKLPLVGLGSWMTFNVGNDQAGRDECAEVMRAFFAEGGRLIDSSPMYGSSQEVIGYGLRKLGLPRQLFSADKVWISSGKKGPEQIEESRRHWGVERFDLLQVHNLMAWEEHLPTLLDMKKAGRLRYVGVTTSDGRRHDEIEKVMRSQPIDFVQISYNVLDREIEERILPLAQERKIAIICNRPLQRGDLIRRVEHAPLPPWAAEIDCANWAQILLKFIVSHPAVTCAIPATSRVDHVRQNVGASYGRMPDEAMRRRIVETVQRI